jgi:hypothetical protein
MDWILVILIYAGTFARGDSVAIHTIPGWSSEQSCKYSGEKLGPLVKGTSKEIRFICLPK